MPESEGLLAIDKQQRITNVNWSEVSINRKAYFKKMAKLKRLDDSLEALITSAVSVAANTPSN